MAHWGKWLLLKILLEVSIKTDVIGFIGGNGVDGRGCWLVFWL